MGTRVFTFTHEAMNTVFEWRIRHAEADYARHAARAAFGVVDRLEAVLSRFVEGSDVWRVNHAEAGERVPLGEDCHACLREAARMCAATGGAFNAGVGEAADVAKAEAAKGIVRGGRAGGGAAAGRRVGAALRRCARGLVCLSEVEDGRAREGFAAFVERRGLSVDLGGIGKGFALDRAGELLAEWGIKNALLSAGGSSVLAIGAGQVAGKTQNGWVVNVAGERLRAPVLLRDCALGGSGTGVLGRHIVDPRRGGVECVHARAWALAPAAAAADALSTGCMTMSAAEIACAIRALGKGHGVITEDAGSGRMRAWGECVRGGGCVGGGGILGFENPKF